MKKERTSAHKSASPKKIPKNIVAFSYLYKRSLVKLEAPSLYGDTCLNTTISQLTHQQGLRFLRTNERHRHRGGGWAFFMRYRLADESKPAAEKLLQEYGLEANL